VAMIFSPVLGVNGVDRRLAFNISRHVKENRFEIVPIFFNGVGSHSTELFDICYDMITT